MTLEPNAPPEPDDPISLDLTDDRPAQSPSEPQAAPYNPAKHRENMRGWLAVVLVGVVALVIVFAGCALWHGKIEIAELQAFLQIIFTPLIALVGSVIGFYYGGKSD